MGRISLLSLFLYLHWEITCLSTILSIWDPGQLWLIFLRIMQCIFMLFMPLYCMLDIVHFTLLGTEYFCSPRGIFELCPRMQCDPFRSCCIDVSGGSAHLGFLTCVFYPVPHKSWGFSSLGGANRPYPRSCVSTTVPSNPLTWLFLWPEVVPYTHALISGALLTSWGSSLWPLT